MDINEPATTRDLADILKISVRRIQQLSKDGVIPSAGRNQFILGDAIPAFNAYQESVIRAEYAEDSEDVADYERERARLTKAKADMAEMERNLMRGTHHEANAVASVVNEMLASFRQRVLSIPTKTAPLVADCITPSECYAIIEEECHHALRELSDYDPRPVVDRQRAAIAEHQEEDDAGA